MKRPSREEAAAETRQRLIDAGVSLVSEQPAGNVLSHIKAQAVAWRAGVTIGAFYHHWPSQQAYIEDLLDYALGSGRSHSLESAADAVDEGVGEERSFVDTALNAAQTNFDIVVNEPFFPVQLLLVGLAKSEPEIRERLETLYQDITARAIPMYELLLAATGRELRPPVTIEVFAGLYTAMADGIAARELATPGALPVNVFAWTTLALVPALTRRPGDERDVEQWLADEMPTWAT